MELDVKYGNRKLRAAVLWTMLSGNLTLPPSLSAVYIGSEMKNRILFGIG
jgi:hypothetical protein